MTEAIEIKKKSRKSVAPQRELTAAERIGEIDEQIRVLLEERRGLLTKLDQEIQELQQMRTRIPTRCA